MLRYPAHGEVHKDFHGLTCATLHYLIDCYGKDAMIEVLKNTAQKVYRSMHEGLKNGDPEELIEYWKFYFERENGTFSIERVEDEIRLIVQDCPALRHLVKLEQDPDPLMCEGTAIFNDALADGSPFSIETRKTGTFSCVQILKKKENCK